MTADARVRRRREELRQRPDRGARARAASRSSVDAGEFVAVMGPSGCGKSTLLHLAGALETPSAGLGPRRRTRARRRSTPPSRGELRRRDVGYVFQRLNLIPALTAIENVMLPLELDGRTGTRAARDARDRRARSGGSARAARPLSRRLLGRPAATHRDRAAPSSASAGCCSPTSRPVRSTRRAATR